MKKNKTFVTTPSVIARSWHLIDLKDRILGRTASRISQLLMGKHKTCYTPALDCGDWVVAINAGKVKVTGSKSQKKLYRWHTGWPGGFRQKTFSEMMVKDPKKIIELAVSGMLPKNKLRQARLRRLKIFSAEKHSFSDKFKAKPGTKHEKK